jgi:hypothetical protein
MLLGFGRGSPGEVGSRGARVVRRSAEQEIARRRAGDQRVAARQREADPLDRDLGVLVGRGCGLGGERENPRGLRRTSFLLAEPGQECCGADAEREAPLGLEGLPRRLNRLDAPAGELEGLGETQPAVGFETDRAGIRGLENERRRFPVLPAGVGLGEQHRRAGIPGGLVRLLDQRRENPLGLRAPALLEKIRRAREIGVQVRRPAPVRALREGPRGEEPKDGEDNPATRHPDTIQKC